MSKLSRRDLMAGSLAMVANIGQEQPAHADKVEKAHIKGRVRASNNGKLYVAKGVKIKVMHSDGTVDETPKCKPDGTFDFTVELITGICVVTFGASGCYPAAIVAIAGDAVLEIAMISDLGAKRQVEAILAELRHVYQSDTQPQ